MTSKYYIFSEIAIIFYCLYRKLTNDFFLLIPIFSGDTTDLFGNYQNSYFLYINLNFNLFRFRVK